MGFDLEKFFSDLQELLSSKGKATKVLGRLRYFVTSEQQYATECGYLPRKRKK